MKKVKAKDGNYTENGKCDYSKKCTMYVVSHSHKNFLIWDISPEICCFICDECANGDEFNLYLCRKYIFCISDLFYYLSV